MKIDAIVKMANEYLQTVTDVLERGQKAKEIKDNQQYTQEQIQENVKDLRNQLAASQADLAYNKKYLSQALQAANSAMHSLDVYAEGEAHALINQAIGYLMNLNSSLTIHNSPMRLASDIPQLLTILATALEKAKSPQCRSALMRASRFVTGVKQEPAVPPTAPTPTNSNVA